MKKGKIVITIALWVAVIAVLSFFMKPVKNTSCVAEEERLLVTGRSGYELSVVYEEVTRIEYRGELDYGSLLDGVDDGKEKSGRWENDELGQYLLCVNAKVKPCIVLYTAEQTMVINFESQQSTRALYDALVEQINAILHPQSGTEEKPSGEGQMMEVTTRGFVDVDGVKLSAVQIRYDMDLTGAEIDRDTYALEVYTGTVLENFGDGQPGGITDVTIDRDTVTLSVYTDYHLASKSSFASALAVSVTQKKDIAVGNTTIAASENAVDNYAAASGRGGQGANGGGSGGGMRGGGGPGGMMGGSGKSAVYGSYTIEGIDGFRYYTNNTSLRHAGRRAVPQGSLLLRDYRGVFRRGRILRAVCSGEL